MPKRTTCRKHYITLRRQMSQEDVRTKSRDICEKVINCTAYKDAQVILAYYPLGNEVDCMPVLEDALNNGKQVMLPRTLENCEMDFYQISRFSDVEEGHFHVMEPKAYCRKYEPECFVFEKDDLMQDAVQTKKGVLVLVPGVVFDCQGNRYGYGKGYYDRYFSRFPQLKRMGLAYTEQLSVETLECLETDIKMQIIVTEKGIIQVY